MLQATARAADDLLWNPVDVGRRGAGTDRRGSPTGRHRGRPSGVGRDDGPVGRRQVPFTTFVPGHPSQLPGAGRAVRLTQVAWPRCMKPARRPSPSCAACCGHGHRAVQRDVPSRRSRTWCARGRMSTTRRPAWRRCPVQQPGRLLDAPRRTAEPSAFLGACVRDGTATQRAPAMAEQRRRSSPRVRVVRHVPVGAPRRPPAGARRARRPRRASGRCHRALRRQRVNDVVEAGWLAAPTLPQIDVLATR